MPLEMEASCCLSWASSSSVERREEEVGGARAEATRGTQRVLSCSSRQPGRACASSWDACLYECSLFAFVQALGSCSRSVEERKRHELLRNKE